MRNKFHINRLMLFVGLAVFGSLIFASSQTSADTTSRRAYLEPANAPAACGALENGDFENGTSSWIESGEWELIESEGGTALAISKPAIRQNISADPDEAYTLTGSYRTEGVGDGNWTGIGVDYLNGEEKIGDDFIRITESAETFETFTISEVTPSETTAIVVWLYSNNGLVLIVDNLELTWDDCTDPPEPTATPTEAPPEATPTNTPEPPNPPATGDYCEPLANGGFEDGINPWIVSGEWEIVAGRTGNAVSVITPFVRQNLETEPGIAFDVSGYYRTEGEFGSNWTGIGVDYQDSSGEKIGQDFFRITEAVAEYSLFEIAGTTPEDTAFAQLWLYSGNGVTLFVDDIVFEWSDCSTEPPTTPTPEPPVTPTPEPTVPPTETPVVPTPTPTQEPENLEPRIIFDDAVSDNWIMGSWGTVSKNPLNKDPVFSGENSIEVSLANAWSTLFFEAKGSETANKLYAATFDVYGSADTVQTVELEILTKNYQQIAIQTVVIQPGQWSNLEVVLAPITLRDEIGYVTMKNASSADAFYIDNLTLSMLPVGVVNLENQIYLPFVAR